ncbi:MAG: hypothetical protein ACR2KV_17215 [Solirubrobacteraceae bacterium]
MLTNLEIVRAPESGESTAVFDASAEQLLAFSFAVSHHLRWRFGGEGLDVDETLTMRILVTLADQLGALVDAHGHGTLFLAGSAGALLHESVSTYVTMRDLESHQSVEERARLVVLGDVLVDLREVRASLEDAGRGSGQPVFAV